jgi:hypothetical protein
MRTVSCQRFEAAVANRGFPDWHLSIFCSKVKWHARFFCYVFWLEEKGDLLCFCPIKSSRLTHRLTSEQSLWKTYAVQMNTVEG